MNSFATCPEVKNKVMPIVLVQTTTANISFDLRINFEHQFSWLNVLITALQRKMFVQLSNVKE